MPGTTVISDEWRSYSRINSNSGYEPPDPQTIESTWSQVKGMMRKRGVMNTSEELFDIYLPVYGGKNLKMKTHSLKFMST